MTEWVKLARQIGGRGGTGESVSVAIVVKKRRAVHILLSSQAMPRGGRVDVSISKDNARLVRVEIVKTGAFLLARSSSKAAKLCLPWWEGLATRSVGRTPARISEQGEGFMVIELPPAMLAGAQAPTVADANGASGPVDAVRMLSRAGIKSLKLGADRWNVAGETLGRDEVAARLNRLRSSEGKPPIAAACLV